MEKELNYLSEKIESLYEDYNQTIYDLLNQENVNSQDIYNKQGLLDNEIEILESILNYITESIRSK